MEVGDTGFSPHVTAVKFVSGNSSLHLWKCGDFLLYKVKIKVVPEKLLLFLV